MKVYEYNNLTTVSCIQIYVLVLIFSDHFYVAGAMFMSGFIKYINEICFYIYSDM